MNRHPVFFALLIVFLIFVSFMPLDAAENASGQPDIIVKVNRIRQAMDMIDKMAASNTDQPATAPSFLLRSVLFGTDWIDPNRSIVIGIHFKDMEAGGQPKMTALLPYTRPNEDFHISYGAVSKMDHYLVPLPPGSGSAVDDQMAFDLAEASKKATGSLISVEIAASRLLNKADTQIQKMIVDLDTKLKAQTGSSEELAPEEINNFLSNLINIAKQVDTFSMGMDLSESELTLFSDALALKDTDLAKLFTRNAQSRFSRMGSYSPAHDIQFKSASYDINGMIAFFNAVFGEFYKKIGFDLTSIETMASNFTGEMAGGITLTDTDMDIEMIAVLKDAKKTGPDFMKSVYLPWVMDYGKKMAAVYSQQTHGKTIENIFSKTPESTVNGHKVIGIACKVPVDVPGRTATIFSADFRTAMLGDLIISAPNDQRLKELMALAGKLEKKPFGGPLMKMDISLGGYLESIQAMVPETESGMNFNFSDLGSLVYTMDFEKRNLSSKYVLQTDDIRTIVAAFKQAGESEDASSYDRGSSFSQTAPTMLQHSGEGQAALSEKPAPKKEDTAEFWIDKGLLYSTYGNDAEAVKFYKKALQIEPENPKALFNIGISYSTLGEYGLAITALNQAIFLVPDNGDYHYGLGWAYLLKGETGKAMGYIRTAADLGNPDARKYLKKGE